MVLNMIIMQYMPVWKCHDETLIMYNSYMLIKTETVSKIFMCLIHPILIFSYDTDYGFNFLLFIKFLSLLKKLDLQLKLCVLDLDRTRSCNSSTWKAEGRRPQCIPRPGYRVSPYFKTPDQTKQMKKQNILSISLSKLSILSVVLISLNTYTLY